jgi:hypothetical protein
MTKDEALRLALEWLETNKPKISEGSLFVLTHAQVYIAVKTALANEALERKAENARELGLNYYVPCCTDKTCPKCKAALEAKDEPVAIFKADLDCGYVDLLAFQGQPLSDNTLLYTTPPQRTWVTLTEDEIVLISAECAATHQHTDIHFARAIEAKLKEKNND